MPALHKLAMVGGGAGGTATQQAAQSDNATAWTLATTTAFNNASAMNWIGLAYAPKINTLVALSNTAFAANPTAGYIMYSLDGGATYTATPGIQEFNTWTGLCWSDALGLFCAVSSDGATHRCQTSLDGITWTARTIPLSAWASVAWSQDLNLFCAVGAANAIATSPDGINWTARTGPGTSKNWIAVCYAGDTIKKFCAVATSGGGASDFMTSPDGITWTQSTVGPGSGFSWTNLAYSQGLKKVGVIGGNTGVFAQWDGTTWNQISTTVGASPLTGLCWSSQLTLWVMVTTSEIWTSATGLLSSWTQQTSPSTASFQRVTALDAAIPGVSNSSALSKWWYFK